MIKKKIKLKDIDLIQFFGPNNINFKALRNKFNKIEILSRGEELFISGEKIDIKSFEEKFKLIFNHIKNHKSLDVNQLNIIINSDGSAFNKEKNVILYTKTGKKISAKTNNQKKIHEQLMVNDMIFVLGPAGTGKTYTSVALAVNSLKNKEVKKIILTRPAVESGENLGYLPGDLKDKIDPYMQPIYDSLQDMIPKSKLNDFIENGIIQISPLAFMRGRTLDNAFVILDEAQNTTEKQMKMFLTRMGKNSKFIINGDETQIDLPIRSKSGLIHATKTLKNISGISFIKLNNNDIIRHNLINLIINAYKKNEQNN
tara:strand:+ start:1457 stop:2398 length:942 start_codon:yes stop_codon:yes gene_type:complete